LPYQHYRQIAVSRLEPHQKNELRATYAKVGRGELTEEQGQHQVLGKHGGTGANQYTKSRGYIITSASKPKIQRGTSRSYWLARFDRDGPNKPELKAKLANC